MADFDWDAPSDVATYSKTPDLTLADFAKAFEFMKPPNPVAHRPVVIESKYVPESQRVQFRFPRSRRKRIRKKWAKNPKNWRDEAIVIFMNSQHLGIPLLDMPRILVNPRNYGVIRSLREQVNAG